MHWPPPRPPSYPGPAGRRDHPSFPPLTFPAGSGGCTHRSQSASLSRGGWGQGGGHLRPGLVSRSAVRGRLGRAAACVSFRGAGQGAPSCREGVSAAATHAGAGSGGGAERSRPGPRPCRCFGRPPEAVASCPGVYEPGPQAQQLSPGRGGGDPDVRRQTGRRGEQDRRRRSFLTFPSPHPLGGLLPRPAAASAHRKLCKTKTRRLPNVTVPREVAQDGQKTA